MKKLILSVIFLAYGLLSFAQDYQVTSVEHLPNDMTARKTILTEKLDGGHQCAVLRISTQNILEQHRDAFHFECDLGSIIRERRKDGGEICLWVSPGIKILKIKHKVLGNYILNIPEALQGNVQSLNTYRINIVGTSELPQSSLIQGSCQVVFRPNPEEAILYLNGDSIGSGIQTIHSISGTYEWSMEHDLYHTKTGTVKLVKGCSDTVDVVLSPSYGYLKIMNNSEAEYDSITVRLDGKVTSKVPFQSEKLSQGEHEIVLVNKGVPMTSKTITIREQQICSIEIRHLINGFNLFKYKPLSGKLILKSNFEGVSVSIDGQDYGTTPLTLDSITIGTHTIVLTKHGCNTVTKEIVIEENKELDLTIELASACYLSVVSDTAGDKVYCDSNYCGETPLSINVPFGRHTISVERNSHILKKEVLLLQKDLEKTISFSFGQLVQLETRHKNCRVYVDNNYVGRTPMETYLSNGDHMIETEHFWMAGKDEVSISENNPITDIQLQTKLMKPSAFLRNGAFFLTGNLAYVTKNNPVWGLNIGNIGSLSEGGAGWFLSLYSTTNYELLDFDNMLPQADAEGRVNGFLPLYNGEKATFRASVNLGALIRIAGPVYVRLGAGGGVRRYAWKARENGQWVVLDPYSWRTFEASAGLQCCIYNFVFTADALAPLDCLTEKKELVEFRFGCGFCINHKKK